jgi:autotransporter-associated beta strand protein
MVAIGFLTCPGATAQTTFTVNGASGSNSYSAAQSTTGGLVINQIFGIDYLVVGGGGGSGGVRDSGASGAGGAGGLLHNTGSSGVPLALSAASNYAVTVGAGGAGGTGNSSSATSGTNGFNSVVSGAGISTITALGGGGGGPKDNSKTRAAVSGSSGGSGGGGGSTSGTVGTISGGAGTLGQGLDGGATQGFGGGAGTSGTAASPTQGLGLEISITGSATGYAGGGMRFNVGTARLGGGGAGSGTIGSAAQAGSANTGGGGGAPWVGTGTSSNGTRGGSGIVVLRYEGDVLPGLTTSLTAGSGTVTQSTFTGDGTNGVNGQPYQVYSFTIGNSTTSGTFAFNLSGVSQATLDQRLGTILSGSITGAGNLTFNGPGQLTLTAANTYTGTTSVADGTLRVEGSGRIASSARLDVAAGATLAFARSDGYGGAYDGKLAGAGLLRVESGTLAITGANTFSGSTTVLSGAVLDLDGQISNTSLYVTAGAALTGTGSSAGLTTIAGIHNPGNSPGIQTFDSLTYTGTAVVNWDLGANSTSNGPTVNYDQILLTGSLTFDPATQFNLVFNDTGSTVNWTDPFWNSDQEWLVYDQLPAEDVLPTLVTTNWQDGSSNSFNVARPQAFFSLQAGTRDSGPGVYLVYQAIPEPGAVALAGIGLAAAAAMRRRLRLGRPPA